MTNQSSAQLKARARGILCGHYGLPIGAYVVTLLLTFALETLINFFISASASSYFITYAISLIVIIFTTLIDVGYSYLLLNMARGRNYQLKDLLYVFQTMPDHVILVTLRLFLLTLACMIPFLAGAILLLCLPEILLLRVVCILLLIVSMGLVLKVSLDYSQVYLIYLDNPYLSSKEVMQRSRILMKGNRWRYFYLSLSFIGLGFLSLLSFFIGSLWLTPYITMSRIEFYRDLIHEI